MMSLDAKRAVRDSVYRPPRRRHSDVTLTCVDIPDTCCLHARAHTEEKEALSYYVHVGILRLNIEITIG